MLAGENSADGMNNPIPPQNVFYAEPDSLLFALPWYLFFNELSRLAQSGTAGSSVTLLQETTLTAASTTIDETPTVAGALFILKVKQDGTGGRVIVFSANFSSMCQTNLNGDANKTTIMSFFLSEDGLWWPSAYPVIQES